MKIIEGHRKKEIFEILVDDEDFEYLNQFRWLVRSNGGPFYANAWVKDGIWKKTLMHRMILALRGNYIEGFLVDHINHNGLDNRKENLRICSSQQNSQNRRKRKGTSRKFKCVRLLPNGKWVCNIKINEKIMGNVQLDSERLAAIHHDLLVKKFNIKFAIRNIEDPTPEEIQFIESVINRNTYRLHQDSKYRGVYKSKTNGYWYAFIKYDGKAHHIQCENETSAAEKYNQLALNFLGENAKLNII